MPSMASSMAGQGSKVGRYITASMELSGTRPLWVMSCPASKRRAALDKVITTSLECCVPTGSPTSTGMWQDWSCANLTGNSNLDPVSCQISYTWFSSTLDGCRWHRVPCGGGDYGGEPQGGGGPRASPASGAAGVLQSLCDIACWLTGCLILQRQCQDANFHVTDVHRAWQLDTCQRRHNQ